MVVSLGMGIGYKGLYIFIQIYKFEGIFPQTYPLLYGDKLYHFYSLIEVEGSGQQMQL